MDTDAAGIEYVNAAAFDSPWGGATIQDSLMIGHSELREVGSYEQKISTNTRCTTDGVLLPFSSRLTVKNVTFVNFDEDSCRAFGTCAHCFPYDGGAIVRTINLEFVDSPNRVSFPFLHATAINDIDGTLTGSPDSTVIPSTGILDPSDCTTKPEFSIGSVNGSVCKLTKFAKVSWNEMKPQSIDEKDAYFENQHGRDVITWRKKSKTLTNGYTSFLPIDKEVVLSFQNSSHLTNISYNMIIEELPPNQFAYLKTKFLQVPDHFSTTGDTTKNNTYNYPLGSKFEHGDWYFNENLKEMTYLIKSDINNKTLSPPPLTITFNVYRCFFFKCSVPTPPPVPDGRPDSGTRDWSDPDSWDKKRLPIETEDVFIQSTWWMILDMDTPVTVDRLFIYGTLEFEPGKTHDLKANIIMVTGLHGRLIVGWPDNPMPNNVIIRLTGNHQSVDLPVASDLNLGSKALGIFGHVMMFGKKHNVHWTRLQQNLNKGLYFYSYQPPI